MAAWVAGPHPAYQRLADVLVAQMGAGWRGQRVLDVGAGTGTVSLALRRWGGEPVAVDLAVGMLTAARELLGPTPLVAADAGALPFATSSFAGAVSGFCLNHSADPVRFLRELARVVQTGGCVAASTFGAEPDPVAKRVVDAVCAGRGWKPSAWYRELQACSALTDEPDALAAAAGDAGFLDVVVVDRQVDTGLRTPAELVGWRLGMVELAGFVANLDEGARQSLVAEAVEAVASAATDHTLRRRVLLLRSTVAA